MLSEAEYWVLVEKSALHPFTISDIERNYLEANRSRWSHVLTEQWLVLNRSKEQLTINWSKVEDDFKGSSRAYRDAVATNYLRELDFVNGKARQYEVAIEQIGRESLAQTQPESPELAGLYRRAIQRHMDKVGPINGSVEDVELWKALEGVWE